MKHVGDHSQQQGQGVLQGGKSLQPPALPLVECVPWPTSGPRLVGKILLTLQFCMSRENSVGTIIHSPQKSIRAYPSTSSLQWFLS